MSGTLSLAVVVLAVSVAGSSTVIAVRYALAALRYGQSPSRILARHVAEVALGTAGLVSGYAWGVYEALARGADGPPNVRLWIYLVSMALLLIGVVEVSAYQQRRIRLAPEHAEAVRVAIREAMEGQPVHGPASADRVAALAANAVLALEGARVGVAVPEPAEPPTHRGPSPAELTGYGRHALSRDRRLRR